MTDEIPLAVPDLSGNEWTYIKECLDTNFVSSVGPFVSAFEEAFAKAVGAKYAVACSSGTSALHIALRLAGVTANDEVLVSDFTFIATVNPILYEGAVPVLVDAEQDSWNMSPDLVEEELVRRSATGVRLPKALLVAHILGVPADLHRLSRICERYGIVLIEDAAEALGATLVGAPYDNRWAGTVGAIGCYSFNGNKIITSGGGGMITTDSAELAKRAKHITTQARLPGLEYRHDEVGFNYRLTNIAAALGLAQLERLPDFLRKKRDIAARYDAAFSGWTTLSPQPRPSWGDPTMWLYSVLVGRSASKRTRQEVLAFLSEKGIQSRPLWAPVHTMPYLRSAPRLGGEVGLGLFDAGLSLPCSVSVTPSEQQRVVAALADALT